MVTGPARRIGARGEGAERLKPGDIIVFYRTADGGPAWYTSVATTIGVVQEVMQQCQENGFENFALRAKQEEVGGAP